MASSKRLRNWVTQVVCWRTYVFRLIETSNYVQVHCSHSKESDIHAGVNADYKIQSIKVLKRYLDVSDILNVLSHNSFERHGRVRNRRQ